MNLKLRLNLMITALLLTMMLIGAWFMLINAREDVRAEIESTAGLTVHLIDTEILSFADVPIGGPDATPFRLGSLSHIRHLRIEFYDIAGNLRDSNASSDMSDIEHDSPAWFVNLMTTMSPPWQQTRRSVMFGARMIGELVITPDPSYEIAEVWSDTKGILGFMFIFFVAVNVMVYWAVDKALRPVEHILLALTDLERGKLDTRLPSFNLPELASIGIKFNGMAETLQQSIQRNLGLTRQLINLQEDERKSLARDLHDEVGQSITAIHADAQAILTQDNTSKKAQSNIQESALAIVAVTQKMMNMTHQILERLRPDTLDKFGLNVALHDLLASWRTRLNNAVCTLKVSVESSMLPEAISITAYRIVQEGLTNIAKYAEATRVTINVFEAENTLVVMLEDDGKGFNSNQETSGFGLTGMRERVEGLGGEFELDTEIGSGTRIVVRLPLELSLSEQLPSATVVSQFGDFVN